MTARDADAGGDGTDGADGTDDENADDATVRVWLAERTYSDDEQNLVILVYATLDGERYLRKERALTSFSDDRDTYAAIDVSADALASVPDDETREAYAAAAERTAAEYGPGDVV